MGDEKSSVLEFHMLKSNFFRVIHADGAWGGISPRGHIGFAFFSERGAIPRQTRLKVTPTDGGMKSDGPEEIVATEDSKDGIVRELEVQVLMDIQAAMDFHDWLGKKISERIAASQPQTEHMQ